MISRRRLVAGSIASLVPFAAQAQKAVKVYRIGVLETKSIALNAANIDAFRQGLREFEYREGHNLEIEYRSAEGREEQFPALATELVRLKVDLILTRDRRRLWQPRMPHERFRSSWRGLPILF